MSRRGTAGPTTRTSTRLTPYIARSPDGGQSWPSASESGVDQVSAIGIDPNPANYEVREYTCGFAATLISRPASCTRGSALTSLHARGFGRKIMR